MNETDRLESRMRCKAISYDVQRHRYKVHDVVVYVNNAFSLFLFFFIAKNSITLKLKESVDPIGENF
jgi:hypothetical protein